MITITVWNMKGGTGKSTITFNLANSLRMKGARVLVLDLDVQANLTSFFEKDIDRVKANRADIAKMVEENIPLKKCIYRSRFKGLDFVKGSNGIFLFENFLSLKEMLTTVENIYDFCLIDCHPDNLTSSKNALAAADLVLVPILLDGFSRDNLNLVTREIGFVEGLVDADIDYRVLVNRLRNLRTQSEIFYDLIKNHDYPRMETAITDANDVCSALAVHKPLAQHRSKSNVTNDFANLANEIYSIFGLEA